MEQLLREAYQDIFEEKLLAEIVQEGRLRNVDKNVCMINKGDVIINMPLVINGAIKIVDEDEDGHEYLLYYLEKGDTCSMTMTCCLGEKKSEIKAITEQPTTICMLPVRRMEDWMIQYRSWRAYVFDSYNLRMNKMLKAIDTLAFSNMEERLYKYLKNRVVVLQSPKLELTHSRIAHDLNTSRVVISRLLKKLALENKITTNRNSVTVLDSFSKDLH